MRLLFWNEFFLPRIGGTEVFTMRLAQGLIRRGHEVAVVTGAHCAGLAEFEDIQGVPVYRRQFFEALAGSRQQEDKAVELTIEILRSVADIKRSFCPDAVHVNFSGASSYFHLRTARAHKAPTVVTLQAALNDRLNGSRGLFDQIIRQAARIVAVSRAAAANLSKFIGNTKIHVITPGIPFDEFAPGRGFKESETPMIIFLGRLVPEKGADLAIEAVAGLNGAVRLCIIGDGPQRKALEDMVRDRGLTGLVSFVGQVDDLTRRRLLAEGFAMVIPSRHEELFGMVAVEGALSGLPIVAAAVGGLVEVVASHGLLCPPGDATAMAEALNKLVMDRGLAARLGQAGRTHALANHSVDGMVDAYENLYTECAKIPTAM